MDWCRPFFVLSGWLIGGLYFREQNQFGLVDIKRFWVRRWFRTVPPYLCVLAGYIVFGLSPHADFQWYELFFLQNYLASSITTVTVRVSWSLCVEEHFYLLLPIFLGLISRNRKAIVYILPALFILVAVIRTADVTWVGRNWRSYSNYTHFRIDTLIIGVWLASLKYRMPHIWSRIQSYSRPLSIGGVCGLATIILAGPDYYRAESRFMSTWGFSIVGLCYAGILVEATTEKAWFAKVPKRIVAPIALSSYSMYLVHSVFQGAPVRIFDYLGVDALKDQPLLNVAVFLIMSTIASIIMYFAVEKPTIILRDSLFPRR